MEKKVLYITMDGLTDPLGRSQIIPYVAGLAKSGYRVTILSCEKEKNLALNEKNVATTLRDLGISWQYCLYQKKIPLLSQRSNFANLKALAVNQLTAGNNHWLVHCRSYLAGLIGLYLKKKYNAKFLFDMRGFWADERIEGNIWKKSNPFHNYLYRYFKRKEKEMIGGADAIVVLTAEAKKIISVTFLPKAPIEIIPCCADDSHFTIKSAEERSAIRKKLDIPSSAYVLGYLGSIGTWYMLEEMMEFFRICRKKDPNMYFLFVTADDEAKIMEKAREKQVPPEFIRVRQAKREEVPSFLAAFNAGLFFIRPTFSKKASSPTKLAELLACGVPVITNTGIGDVDELVREHKAGILVPDLSEKEMSLAARELKELNRLTPEHYRRIACANFSLEKGIAVYERIYRTLFTN